VCRPVYLFLTLFFNPHFISNNKKLPPIHPGDSSVQATIGERAASLATEGDLVDRARAAREGVGLVGGWRAAREYAKIVGGGRARLYLLAPHHRHAIKPPTRARGKP
jgi:hypothetical protein